MLSRILIAACLAVLPIWQASASTLLDAQYSVSLNGGPDITVPGSFVQGGALGEISALPSPTLHAKLHGTGTSHVGLVYWFRVDGPTDHAPVTLKVAGKISLSAGGAVFKKSQIWGLSASLIAQSFKDSLAVNPFADQLDRKLATVDCNPISLGDIPVSPPIPTCVSTAQDQDVLLSLNTLTGADNFISMNAIVNNAETFTAEFDALADPVISFAPGFDPTGYSIVFSDGIGNSTAVPLPGGLALMGAAAGMLLGRRRRRQ